MWAMKGHALELYGWADPKLFANDSIFFLHLDYPLFLPALEAVAFRAMGGFDPQLPATKEIDRMDFVIRHFTTRAASRSSSFPNALS